MVTHPESDHHVEDLVGGWFDSSLTERGQHQAALLAGRLRALVPDATPVEVFSSDLTRATQTANAISNRFGVSPTLVPGLREKSYGDAEGRPQAWLDERFQPPPAVGDRMDHSEGIQGAETRREFATRVYGAMDSILTSPSPHLVVVTHGFALTFLVSSWIGLPLDAAGRVNFRASSGGLTVLEEDDHFHNRTVALLNDTVHLAGS